jgi:iron complex outermembrane receptor protein
MSRSDARQRAAQRRCRPLLIAAALAIASAPGLARAQPEGTLVVHVRSDAGPVPQADVQAGTQAAVTDDRGEARLRLPSGTAELTVSRFGFAPVRRRLSVAPLTETAVTIELEAAAVLEEDVIVTATRTTRRVQDLPLRVEVVPQEEIDEKLSMTPGDVAMMLTETNGLRVVGTSPSLGAASVRVQGLRGRYTQLLADGLPSYGQVGSIGVLQIPPMDLAQVEVIKGVASALYGASALGGVINLVSRRPQTGQPERELLVNQTSRGGTDVVGWLSQKPGEHWGYTLLSGVHRQQGQDIDGDGWTNLPDYTRGMIRPRLFWEDGAGRSVFVTLGAMAEDRAGGTRPGIRAPDGAAFREALDTRRLDAGIVARFLASGTRVVTLRASGVGQWHRHQFGEAREQDRHRTAFAEASITGLDRGHSWVVGGALQRDTYRARALPEFDYTYVVPGVFVQDDVTPVSWVTVSASARLDRHNRFGTFLSPRVSALVRLGGGWTLRPSAGAGFFAPTPFIEETEGTGLSRLTPLGSLRAEQGRSTSVDLGWKRGPIEVTATWFRSSIHHAATLEATAAVGATDRPMTIRNATGPGRTSGSELIARLHHGHMDLIATHMYLRSTEADPVTGARRDVALNPRHTAGLDWLWNFEGRGRVGVEVFYTGRQRVADSPYRDRADPYLLWGLIGEWRVGTARLFVNGENLANVRQTRHDPLIRPSRALDGRWTVDAWGPLDGRTINAGVRLGF